jgi:CRISPR-associated endonuclease/helicase Cas3
MNFGCSLSKQAKDLWGKLSQDKLHWLPLYIHLQDTAETAKLLWDNWLPLHTKNKISESFDNLDDAKTLFIFLAASHDLGKASPFFQKKAKRFGYLSVVERLEQDGFNFENVHDCDLTHSVVSEAILKDFGIPTCCADIVGGHHGKPPANLHAITHAEHCGTCSGIGVSPWKEVQKNLFDFALSISGVKSSLSDIQISVTSQVLLSGMVIMADWIASGELFPLIPLNSPTGNLNSKQRAITAWKQLDLPKFGSFSDHCNHADLYQKRFAIQSPRPMQKSVIQIVDKIKNPGIIVIEAPMGEGKTEAALAAAELVGKRCGLSGAYFALPTQATSDGIFKRFEKWIEHLHDSGRQSIFLAHGKSGFNKDYEGIRLNSNITQYDQGSNDSSEEVIVHDWTQGRKKGLLSDFVVGTVDQVLMCGLKQKHLALRHVGIVNKVVIVDECHAYDTYMCSYLELVLKWLGAYHVPVILLSATLPASKRDSLIDAYLSVSRNHPKKLGEKSFLQLRAAKLQKTDLSQPSKEAVVKPIKGYPLITYSDGNQIYQAVSPASKSPHNVYIKKIDEQELLPILEKKLIDGGCIGIIRNTVREAQDTAQKLIEVYGTDNVRLLHSQFLACDRVAKETEIRKLLGPPADQHDSMRPEKLIVVGTQVMEQSLDVDFDLLITDICPMDLLLQRIGRLQRHQRPLPRPKEFADPYCYVLGVHDDGSFDLGSEKVYGKYLLLRTAAFLPKTISIPNEIPQLVAKAYDSKPKYEQEAKKNLVLRYGNSILKDFDSSYKEYVILQKDKRIRSEGFQIKGPIEQRKNLLGWLNAPIKDDMSGKRAEATVRDIDDSIEVIIVIKKKDGAFYTVPSAQDFADTQIVLPNEKLEKVIAGCSVTLPRYFTMPYRIEKTIKELEEKILKEGIQSWYDSCWLRDELFLIFDQDGYAELLGKKLQYDTTYGLRML